MNDPQLNQCINTVTDLMKNDPARAAAVIGIVRTAFQAGYFRAVREIDERIFVMRSGGLQ